MIPDGTRHCYVEERRVKDRVYRDGRRRFQLTIDHYIPKSMGGADGPTHLVHLYCQCVQGGKIGRPTPERAVAAGRIGGRATRDRGVGMFAPENWGKGGRVAVEKGVGIHAPGMAAKGGRIIGPAVGQAHKDRGTAIFAPGMAAKGGRITSCLRWNVRRGKPCTCGYHKAA